MNGLHRPDVVPLPTGRRPHVSVIVPCFNYGRWLEGCVESALSQSSVEVDVVIINDASSDNSGDVARNLVARTSGRVRLIDHETNRGHIASVNEGLQHANGEYIVKLDADDLLTVGSMERAVALMEACPEVGFVYGRPLHFGNDVDSSMTLLHKWLNRSSYLKTDRPGDHDIDVAVRGWTVWRGSTWIERVCARGANCISQPEVVMRASSMRAAGPYDEALPHTSDLAMWLGIAAISDVGYIEGAIQGLYRVHASSMQRTVNGGKLRDLGGLLAAFEAILGGSPPRVEGAQRLLSLARSRLAVDALDVACRAFDRGRVATVPVDEYVDFALGACDRAKSSATWRALQRRQRLGARWAPHFPPFIVEAALRPARDELRARRWWRHGV